MTVENISWSISTKECCRPRRGLNPRPPGLQSDGASNWATEAGIFPNAFGPKEEVKNRFLRWRLSQISERSNFSNFLFYNFLSVWPFNLGLEAKNRFSRGQLWQPSWISQRYDFAIFNLQITPMLPTKFQVNWPFGSGEEVQIDFQDVPLWQPSWISDQSDFCYFWSTSHPYAS